MQPLPWVACSRCPGSRAAAAPPAAAADGAYACTIARIAQQCTSTRAVRAAGARGGLLVIELQGAEWLGTSDPPTALQLRCREYPVSTL
jgi:hypothetical protein